MVWMKQGLRRCCSSQFDLWGSPARLPPISFATWDSARAEMSSFPLEAWCQIYEPVDGGKHRQPIWRCRLLSSIASKGGSIMLALLPAFPLSSEVVLELLLGVSSNESRAMAW